MRIERQSWGTGLSIPCSLGRGLSTTVARKVDGVAGPGGAQLQPHVASSTRMVRGGVLAIGYTVELGPKVGGLVTGQL